MKIDDALETITRFFNDLIGTLVPGLVLITGLLVMHIGNSDHLNELISKSSGILLSMVLALSYALGHIILAVFSSVIQKPLQRCGVLSNNPIKSLDKKKLFVLFQKLLSKKIDELTLDKPDEVAAKDWGYNDLRSLALSMSNEASSLGRRFMFISLLCNGVGTAILVMLIDFSASTLLAPGMLYQYPVALPAFAQILLMLMGVYASYKQGDVFYIRAMSTPFPVAVSQFLIK